MLSFLLLPLVFAAPCRLSEDDVNTTVINLFDCDPPSDLFDRFLFVKNFSLSTNLLELDRSQQHSWRPNQSPIDVLVTSVRPGPCMELARGVERHFGRSRSALF
jgi:hypothetical protein